MTPEEMDDLILGSLAGALSDEDRRRLEARLAEDPEAARRFAELALQEGLLREMAETKRRRARPAAGHTRASRRSSAPSFPRLGVWAAAAALFVAVLAFVISQGRADRGSSRTGGGASLTREEAARARKRAEEAVARVRAERERLEKEFAAREEEKRRLQEAWKQAKGEKEREELKAREAELARTVEEFRAKVAAARKRQEDAEAAIVKGVDPLRTPQDGPAVASQETQVAVAKIERAEDAFVVTSVGRTPVRGGDDLLAGQALEAGGKGAAVITYPDETRLEVGSGSEVKDFKAQGGKRVLVARGSVRAEVTKQPKDQPMVFATPHGEATVLGTTLRIVVDLDKKKGTRLEVEEGKVRLKNLAGKMVEVPSGHFAVAAVGVDLVARRLPQLILSEDFQNPRTVGTAWLGIVGGFPSTTREGMLEIDLTPQPGDPFIGGWHTPGGLRSRKAFPVPLRITFDLEMSASHNGITPTLVLKPPSTAVGPGNLVYWGRNVVQVVRIGASVWIVIGTGSGERKLQDVSLPHLPGRPELWRVEIDRATISLSVDGTERIRPVPHGMDLTEDYQIGLEASSKSYAPAGVKVRFDNLRVEALGEK